MTDSHSVWNTELLADVGVTGLSVQCVRVRGQIIFKRHLMLTIDLSITFPAHRDIKASCGGDQWRNTVTTISIKSISIIHYRLVIVSLYEAENLCNNPFVEWIQLFLFLFLIVFWIMQLFCSDQSKPQFFAKVSFSLLLCSNSPCSSSYPRSCFRVISDGDFFLSLNLHYCGVNT